MVDSPCTSCLRFERPFTPCQIHNRESTFFLPFLRFTVPGLEIERHDTVAAAAVRVAECRGGSSESIPLSDELEGFVFVLDKFSCQAFVFSIFDVLGKNGRDDAEEEEEEGEERYDESKK